MKEIYTSTFEKLLNQPLKTIVFFERNLRLDFWFTPRFLENQTPTNPQKPLCFLKEIDASIFNLRLDFWKITEPPNNPCAYWERCTPRLLIYASIFKKITEPLKTLVFIERDVRLDF